MSVKLTSSDALRGMKGKEGLVLQGCGGDLDEWVDGINELLTESNILLGNTKFNAFDCCAFRHEELTNILFPFTENVKLDIGKLAMWRIQTHEQFGGTWLSDYVENKLDGFTVNEVETENESFNMKLQ